LLTARASTATYSNLPETAAEDAEFGNASSSL
jgi:hypothetical protein